MPTEDFLTDNIQSGWLAEHDTLGQLLSFVVHAYPLAADNTDLEYGLMAAVHCSGVTADGKPTSMVILSPLTRSQITPVYPELN